MAETINIGTRGSDLALAQTQPVAVAVRDGLGFDVNIKVVKTRGDEAAGRPLREMEGVGFFTRELEEALLGRKVDVAVHSYKDMPSSMPPGLALAAVTRREEPGDVLVALPEVWREGQEISLAEGAVVGIGSVRRRAQLSGLRPDLQIRDLRGNLTTRLEKLAAGQCQAIIIAAAGLNRLKPDIGRFRVQPLAVERFVPSPCQGALAIQMRRDDARLPAVHRALHDGVTGTATDLERKVLGYFGGGCSLPLGVLALRTEEGWEMFGFWQDEDSPPVWSRVAGHIVENV